MKLVNSKYIFFYIILCTFVCSSIFTQSLYAKKYIKLLNLKDNNVIDQASIDLDANPGLIKQEDGTFLFTSPRSIDSIYRYGSITGTSNNDIVTMDGKFTFDKLDLLDGENTLNIKADSYFYQDIYYSPNSSLNIRNISTFNIEKGFDADDFRLTLNKYKTTFNFNGLGSSNQDSANAIKFRSLSFIKGSSSAPIEFNVNNASIQFYKLSIPNNNVIFNLKDAEVDDRGDPNKNTSSSIYFNEGLDKSGGNNEINMGNYSSIKTYGNAFKLGGRNTINMKKGSSIDGGVQFKDSDNIINIRSIGENDYKDNANIANVGSLTFDKDNTNINIEEYSNFKVGNQILANGNNTTIVIGKNSIFYSGAEVQLMGSNNYIKIGENSNISSNFNFASTSSNNTFTVDTGSTSVTITGSIKANKSNSTFKLLGTGTLNIDSQITLQGLDGFDNIDLGTGKIIFSNIYNQTNDATLAVGLLENSSKETSARMSLNKLAQFNDSTLNIKFSGMSKYVSKINDNYKLNLFSVGKIGDGNFTKFQDISLKDVKFKNSLYTANYSISEDQLQFNLTKCNTFEDVVSGKDNCNVNNFVNSSNYVVQYAKFLDILTQTKNLQDKYYNMLDNLSYLDAKDLEEALNGYLPINNDLLFNLDSNIFNDFKQISLNAKPYKISQNSISLWSALNHSNISIDNYKEATGASANGNNITFGAEYSLFDFLKIGADIGYVKYTVNANLNSFTGKSSNVYYGMYGSSNLSNNISLNFNLGVLKSYYNLKRKLINNESVEAKPNFTQTSLDALLLYKIRLKTFLFMPFVSLGYSAANLKNYTEQGYIAYRVDSSKFNNLETGIGIKALTTKRINNNIVIPAITLGVYNSLQNNIITNIHIADFKDVSIPVEFYNLNYGGLFAAGNFSISYKLDYGISIDANAGFNIGANRKSYNLGATINIMLI